MCARHDIKLENERFLHTRQGEVLAEGKSVVVRRGLKEAGSKALARRTGIAYEAYRSDKGSRHSEVQYLTGRPMRKCCEHKRESFIFLPGEISHRARGLLKSRGFEMRCEKSAEGILGNWKRAGQFLGGLTVTEGQNPS